MTGLTYKDAGVDNDAKKSSSKLLYEAAKKTWKNREGKLGEVITPFDDFSGVRAIDVGGLPKGTMMNIGLDGVGTKIELAERLNDHTTIAYDLIAMVCDDAIVRGAEPVLVGSLLDVNTLAGEAHRDKVEQIAKGYVDAAADANVAIVNGEVAELGKRVGGFGPFNYNWGAVVVWFAEKNRMFTGREIKKDDYLVGLREHGFRSNGISLVRKILANRFGEEWHKEKSVRDLGELALWPSAIYSKAVVDMTGGYSGEPKAEVHGFAHITGGGLPEKLSRVLEPSGLGALVDSPFKPTAHVKYIQELGDVTDKEAYSTWNMGQGGVVFTPEPDVVRRIADENKIDARVIGRVIAKPGVTIISKSRSSGTELVFPKQVA